MYFTKGDTITLKKIDNKNDLSVSESTCQGPPLPTVENHFHKSYIPNKEEVTY